MSFQTSCVSQQYMHLMSVMFPCCSTCIYKFIIGYREIFSGYLILIPPLLLSVNYKCAIFLECYTCIFQLWYEIVQPLILILS